MVRCCTPSSPMGRITAGPSLPEAPLPPLRQLHLEPSKCMSEAETTCPQVHMGVCDGVRVGVGWGDVACPCGRSRGAVCGPAGTALPLSLSLSPLLSAPPPHHRHKGDATNYLLNPPLSPVLGSPSRWLGVPRAGVGCAGLRLRCCRLGGRLSSAPPLSTPFHPPSDAREETF
jgi:hypothetical protein